MNERLQRKYNNYSGRKELDPNVWKKQVNNRVQQLRIKNILRKLGFNKHSMGYIGESKSMYNNNNQANMAFRQVFFNMNVPTRLSLTTYKLQPENLALLKSIPIKVLAHELRRTSNYRMTNNSGKKTNSLLFSNQPTLGNVKHNYAPINNYNWRYSKAYDILRRLRLEFEFDQLMQHTLHKKLNNILKSRKFENIIQKNNIANIKAIPMGRIYKIIMALNKNYYDPNKPKPTTKTYIPRGPTKTTTQTQTNTNTNRQTQTNLPPRRNTSTPKRTFKNRFSSFFTRKKSPKSPNFSPI